LLTDNSHTLSIRWALPCISSLLSLLGKLSDRLYILPSVITIVTQFSANCAQIAKFANFEKNYSLQGREGFAQKLRAKAKFAKNCNFARKGEICAKIVPRKIAVFFRDSVA